MYAFNLSNVNVLHEIYVNSPIGKVTYKYLSYRKLQIFPHSVQMQGHTDQKKLSIWMLFTQCELFVEVLTP